jgi:UDP-N-acetylglucosamine 2-epimerase (non-hydrolysing)
MRKVLFIYGTRPEAIKMAPLIKKMGASSLQPIICLTGQHRAMLDQVNAFFGIIGNYDLNVMRPDQSLIDVTARVLEGANRVIEEARPDLVFVQGDTSSAFVGALAAYYGKVSVAHLEAGLRSGCKYSPFPEEVNRSLISRIADLHFAPTQSAKENLSREGVAGEVHVVGNTVIDALLLGLQIIKNTGEASLRDRLEEINFSRRLILVTGHRRESFGEPFERICKALASIARIRPDCAIVYPVHLNPSVREPVFRLLGGVPNIVLLEPLDYPCLIWLMSKCELILTDSGGIQEEAPSLGKPVLVLRDVTERMEGVEAGTARLVGTDPQKIVTETVRLLEDRSEYEKMARAINPYGDGEASSRIVGILEKWFNRKAATQDEK